MVAYNNILAQNGNDFMGISLDNDTLSAVWANTRDGSLDVWFVRTVAKTGKATSITLIESESSNINIFPNPSDGIYHIEMNDQYKIKTIHIFDRSGTRVAQFKSNSVTVQLNLTEFAQGIYFLVINSDNGVFTKKIMR